MVAIDNMDRQLSSSDNEGSCVLVELLGAVYNTAITAAVWNILFKTQNCKDYMLCYQNNNKSNSISDALPGEFSSSYRKLRDLMVRVALVGAVILFSFVGSLVAYNVVNVYFYTMLSDKAGVYVDKLLCWEPVSDDHAPLLFFLGIVLPSALCIWCLLITNGFLTNLTPPIVQELQQNMAMLAESNGQCVSQSEVQEQLKPDDKQQEDETPDKEQTSKQLKTSTPSPQQQQAEESQMYGSSMKDTEDASEAATEYQLQETTSAGSPYMEGYMRGRVLGLRFCEFICAMLCTSLWMLLHVQLVRLYMLCGILLLEFCGLCRGEQKKKNYV